MSPGEYKVCMAVDSNGSGKNAQAVDSCKVISIGAQTGTTTHSNPADSAKVVVDYTVDPANDTGKMYLAVFEGTGDAHDPAAIMNGVEAKCNANFPQTATGTMTIDPCNLTTGVAYKICTAADSDGAGTDLVQIGTCHNVTYTVQTGSTVLQSPNDQNKVVVDYTVDPAYTSGKVYVSVFEGVGATHDPTAIKDGVEAKCTKSDVQAASGTMTLDPCLLTPGIDYKICTAADEDGAGRNVVQIGTCHEIKFPSIPISDFKVHENPMIPKFKMTYDIEDPVAGVGKFYWCIVAENTWTAPTAGDICGCVNQICKGDILQQNNDMISTELTCTGTPGLEKGKKI
eukprot:UN05205